MKHDELVRKLRSGCDANTAFLLCYEAADAIAALREGRDNWCALAAASNEDFRITAQERDAARAEVERLRALLTDARQAIWSLDAREDWNDELARIDAALAGKGAK